jgi:hypothetical protein
MTTDDDSFEANIIRGLPRNEAAKLDNIIAVANRVSEHFKNSDALLAEFYAAVADVATELKQLKAK